MKVSSAVVLLLFASSFLLLIRFQPYIPNRIEPAVASKTRCTDRDIKAYIRQNGAWPTGKWLPSGKDTSLSSADLTFKPNLTCSISTSHLTPSELQTCLLPKSHNYLVTYGASNAKFYFKAIYKKVKNFMTCTLVKNERIDQDTNARDLGYFAKITKDGTKFEFRVEQARCWTCFSVQYKCFHNNGKVLVIEHIMTPTLMLEGVNVTIVGTNSSMQVGFQEFIFHHYLKDVYPDLLFIFPPFNHVARMTHPSNTAKNFAAFVSLIHRFVPHSTKVYWISGFREVEQRRRIQKNAFVKYYGLYPTEGITKLNQVMFETLENFWSDYASMDFTFWDMMQASEGMETWSRDGVHMYPKWYAQMSHHFLAIHCASRQHLRM
jgi:hypothetical protein